MATNRCRPYSVLAIKYQPGGLAASSRSPQSRGCYLHPNGQKALAVPGRFQVALPVELRRSANGHGYRGDRSANTSGVVGKTAATARRTNSSYAHSPLLPVCRVRTRFKLGIKQISCPPEPGLKRVSGGMPFPRSPPSKAGNSQPCDQERASRPKLFWVTPVTECVGAAVCSTNQRGTT